MMQLHIILLAWKNPADALAQLERIKTWKLSKQITLVHNEGGGLQLAPALQYIPIPTNRGYAGGINAGLQAKGFQNPHAILLLNNDALISESEVSTLLNHLEGHPEIGIIGPILQEGKTASYGGRNPLHHTHTRITRQPSGAGPLHDVAYVPGTALLMRSEIVASIGLLNEAFFFSGEIADYCRRARRAGWRCVLATDACARHHVADTENLRASLYRYYTLRNRFLMAREEHTGWRLTIWQGYWTLMGAGMWLRTVHQDRKGARAIMFALRDGWHQTFGNRNGLFHV